MSKPVWYLVPDILDFTDKVRSIVYNNFGSWEKEIKEENLIDSVSEKEKEELDKILSHKESLLIVKENIKRQKNKQTKKIRYIIDDKIFAEIINSLNDRMVSNILNSLVQKGLIDTAYDDEANDFVFWIKNNDKTQEEKPETD